MRWGDKEMTNHCRGARDRKSACENPCNAVEESFDWAAGFCRVRRVVFWRIIYEFTIGREDGVGDGFDEGDRAGDCTRVGGGGGAGGGEWADGGVGAAGGRKNR